jgi:hypothetical protein
MQIGLLAPNYKPSASKGIKTSDFPNPRHIIGLICFSILISWVIVSKTHYMLAALGIVLFILFVLKFEFIFPLLLITRSSLDIFTDIGFYIGPMKLNVPASVSMFIDAAGLFYLALIYSLRKNEKAIFDDISKSFSLWLLALTFWVFRAYHHLGIEGFIGLREWIRLFSLLIIYMLSKELIRIKGYEYLINCILLSLVMPLAVGGYQILSKQGRFIADIHRIYGTLAHPNAFSLYLTLFIGVTIWKLKFSEKPKFWYCLIVILFIEQIGTFSLGGMVMMACFLFIFIIGEFEARGRLLSFLILAIFLAIFFSLESGQERIAKLQAMPALQEVWDREIVTNSFSWRIVNWKLLYEQWTKTPYLGYGLYTIGLVNPWRGYAAHNDYIRFLIELGIVGIAIYLWFQFKIASILIKKYKHCKNIEQKYLAMVMGGIYISMIIGSSVDNHISYTTFQFYFWALLACVMQKSTVQSDNKDTDLFTHPAEKDTVKV